jgi:chitin disaccharide deacetylase
MTSMLELLTSVNLADDSFPKFPSNALRAVLVTFRDLGMTHAANVGVYEALQSTRGSASIAVPCPWAREASSRRQHEDIGVQLTLNAQHDLYRWGPITHAPSLVDGNGGFPTTTGDLWEHADLDEVRRECRSQIERALFWGIDVSHLVSHLDALAMRAEFFDVLLELAYEFSLPLGLPDPEQSELAGFPLRALARDEGVYFPDQTIDLMHTTPTVEFLNGIYNTLAPGVTELRFSPTIHSPEVEALSPGWKNEVAQYEFLTGSGGGVLARLSQEHDIPMITFGHVRDRQRLVNPTGVGSGRQP